MTEDQIEARLEHLENDRFLLEMKDVWDEDDFVEYTTLETEIRCLRSHAPEFLSANDKAPNIAASQA